LSSIGSAFPAPSPLIRPLAPGSFLSIYGQLLADFAADASGTLPTQLGNTQVFFNDRPGVISHADRGQINVLVPYGVNVHTSNQIRIQRGLTLSNPVAVDIADAQPSVLQDNGNAILLDYPANGSPAFPVSSAAPAAAGDVLVMYCVGLGMADQPIADGAPSPFSPLASVSGVTVNIGGQNAPAQAALAPGYVGLYQINAVMPAGVAPGSVVPLTVTAGGQTSPIVTLAVR
jgi:adhesin/invasin